MDGSGYLLVGWQYSSPLSTCVVSRSNLSVRKLLDELAVAEQVHEDLAGKLKRECPS